MKTVKKLLPFFCVLLIGGVFAYSLVSDMYSEKTQYGFACGSEVKITVFGTAGGEEKAKKALDEILRLDDFVLSDTKASSAVYLLNKDGEYTDENGELIKYINRCTQLISMCDKMTLLSKPFANAWDITGDGRVPDENEIAEAVRQADMNNLSVNGNKITLQNGGLLSFGAFGKGTACERAIETLKTEGAKCGLVTVGGTVGVFGKNGKEGAFTIGVRDPFGSTGDYFATVSVNDCYLSTSGDYEKFFEKDGIKYCHIFDATTGYPVQSDITSVTVICDGGTKSDFLSTAIFLLGDDGIELAKKENAEIIIVKKDKSVFISSSLQDKFNLVNDDFTVNTV